MKLLYKNAINCKSLVLVVMFCFLSSFLHAQTPTVYNPSPDPTVCVNKNVVFNYSGSCSNLTWQVEGGTWTVVSSSNTSITIKWTTATTAAKVTARCNSAPSQSAATTYFTVYSASGTASVSITGPSSICLNSSATFQATPVNGGSGPLYVWMVNGVTKQSGTSSSFTTTQLVNSDVVKVQLTSNASCLATGTATSNSITVTTTNPLPVSVFISDPTPLCPGQTNTTFTATSTNGGSSPVYTWYRNGVVATDNQSSGNVYIPHYTLSVGDKIKCQVNSNASCISNNPATSNEVTISFQNAATITIINTPAIVCSGDPTTFTATSNYPITSYNWSALNGTVTGTSSTFTVNGATSNYTVNLSVGLSACATNNTASGSKTLTVNPKPASSISPTGSLKICSSCSQTITASPATGMYTYQWKNNTAVIPNQGTNVYTATSGGSYFVEITSGGCMAPSSTLNLTQNVLPVVNAGSDQILTLPSNMITLNGSASDADGTIVTYLWKILGSSYATLSGTATPILNVSDLTYGSYTFRLTVTDNFGESTYDDVVVTVNYPLNNYNYIREFDVLKEGQTSESTLESLPIEQKSVSWKYFDGLGRPNQTVSLQASPGKNDLVSPIAYDPYGRETKKYLSYSDGTNGYYKENALKDPASTATLEQDLYRSGKQYAFYQPGGILAKDQFPYAETRLEASPLGRVLEQGAPGSVWQPDGTDSYTSLDRTVKYSYTSNTASDSVLLWTYAYPTSTFTLGLVNASTGTTPIYYSANTLYKNSTKDEQYNQVIEFKDKFGRTILKKVQASSGKYAQTYYIYDDFGNLVCVIQPEGVKAIWKTPTSDYFNQTDAVKDAFLTRWAFRYTYDLRSRMTQKQVPSADPVYMVYDNRDRLVLTQDGNQRKDASSNPLTNWLFIKYDILNRPILTGIYIADSILTQSKMQDRVNRFYKSGGAWFESPKTLTGNVHGYDNASFPSVANQDQYLTVTYYDDYGFKSLYGSTEYDFKSTELPPDAVNGYPGQITTPFTGTLGLVTGTKVKMLSGNTWLKSVNYYDDHYRVVQSTTDNIKGYTATTNIYDFVGKVLRTKSSLFLGQPVAWANLTGVQLQGDVLSSIGTGSWGDVTTSSQVLPANTDGWFEITFGNNTPYLEIGLVDVYSGSSYTNIDYGWYIQGFLTYAKENGTTVWSTGNASPGDVFRIERVNGMIYYKRNGVVYYKSVVSSTTSLLAQVSFYTSGAKVSQGRLSNTFTGGAAPVVVSYFVKRFDYDHAGRLLKTWHQIKDGGEVLLTYNVYNELGQLIDKKLYNTDLPSVADNSRSFKQSVDYRYNIRGWLTSINNSTLSNDATTNDDTGDLFGMNLLYEQSDASLGNNGLYNSNISGMRWSNNLGTGPVSENGYKFGYDVMNRLTAANSRANKVGTWQTGDYSENGLSYDLNGNIQSLSRRSDGKIVIDSLGYNYGSGTSLSNKLLSVTDKVADATNKAKGFSDGNTAGSDYTYDWNGNLLTNKNKGITVPITYNHLNLPTTVVRSYSNINYLYDATGNKHGQVASYGTTQKFTDYVGPWIFENNELQFLQHDEGRIMLTSQQKLYASSCDVVTTDFVSTTNITLGSSTINGEKYIQVTPTVGVNMNKLGVSQIGNVIPVVEGERYVFRVKGYNGAPANANLYVKGNTTDVLWPGACLPYTAVNESWVEESFTIPTGVTQITLGVLFNSSASATASNVFYINEIEFHKKTSSTPEYQYYLKDHLGNVRLTFTTTPETVADVATLETANTSTERSKFLRYDNARLVNHYLFDHTNGSLPTTTSGAAQRLSGQTNEVYGLAKSLSVMPGDVINMEVYAKYIDSNSANRTAALNTLISQIASGTAAAGTVVDGSTYTSSTTTFPYAGGLNGTSSSGGTGPKAYLNWLVFDKNFVLIASKSGYKRMTTSARETGQDIAHEYLSGSVTIAEPGYVYIYLSNEEGVNASEVYFDDFKVTHTKSAVIASNDYYPFGLTYNSYSRENSTKQDYQYNGKEMQDELNLGWLDYGARMYMSEIGRWGVIDPLSEKMSMHSPYNYTFDNPIRFIDVGGMGPGDPIASKYSNSGNVLIVLIDANMKINTKNLDDSNWDYAIVSHLPDAAKWLNSTYGVDGNDVSNFVLRTHGVSTPDGQALSIPGSTPLTVEEFKKGTNENVVAIKEMGNRLSNGATVLFTACNVNFNGNALSNEIFRTLGGNHKNLTLYTNRATSELLLPWVDKNGKYVYSTILLGLSLTPPESRWGNNGTWVRTTRAGTQALPKGSSVMINGNGSIGETDFKIPNIPRKSKTFEPYLGSAGPAGSQRYSEFK